MPCLRLDDRTFLCVPPRAQPATDYRERCAGHLFRFANPGGRLIRCDKCNRRRPARNLLVTAQEWYGHTFFCQPGKGCAVKGWRRLERRPRCPATRGERS